MMKEEEENVTESVGQNWHQNFTFPYVCVLCY